MSAPARPHRGQTVRVFCLALLGLLLAQAAWALVVPPFRGIDEHEHAFKAAAVARGDWHPDHRLAPSGWGETLTVPTDLAEAALPICTTLKYVEDNCVPRPSGTAGMSYVGSSAARYNPAFYAVIGAAALPFHGVGALYAMRAASALMCALLMALAFTAARSWARSAWVPAGFLLAATPVTIYSESIASPNGVELAAAFLVWASLLGIARLPAGDRRVLPFITTAAVGAVPLAVVRTLGPLWLVLIVATCAALASRTQIVSVLRLRRLRIAVLVVAVLGSFGPIWAWTAKANQVSDVGAHVSGMWGDLPGQWMLWFLQSIAAFPSRDEIAPIGLYAIALVAMWVLAAIAWRQGAARERIVLVAIVVISTLVAMAVTIAAYPQAAFVWQGRYGYPYAAGFVLICAVMMDRRAAGGRSPAVVLAGVGIVTVTIELVGMLHVLRLQLAHSPLSGTAAWPAPSPAVVVALVVVSTAALVLAGLLPSRSASAPSPDRVAAAAVNGAQLATESSTAGV